MNRKMKFYGMGLLLSLACGALFSCNQGTGDAAPQEAASDSSAATANAPATPQTAIADITATYPDTAVSGKATFTAENNGQVKLDIQLSIPAKAGKEVAVHLHEHGDCSDAGKGAHGHWNPTNDQHGKWGGAHFHRGDIGNVKLDAQGNGTFEMTTDLWSIGGSDSTKNILGRAVIVHGGTDDYVSQPTGNAGDRIGCAVIK